MQDIKDTEGTLMIDCIGSTKEYKITAKRNCGISVPTKDLCYCSKDLSKVYVFSNTTK